MPSATSCVLNEAIFTAVVTVDGTTIEQPFYTSNSLGDYPSDQLWFNTIDTILTSFDSIGNVIINPTQNSITLEKIKTLTEELSIDVTKFENGNKSAGTRARKTAQDLKALLQTLRNEILDERKKDENA